MRTSETKICLVQRKELLDLDHGILRVLDRMADSAGVHVDLVVVATLHCLVAEEVDRRVGDPARLFGLVLQVAQAVRLVPARGKDIEGELAADGEASRGVSINTYRKGSS